MSLWKMIKGVRLDEKRHLQVKRKYTDKYPEIKVGKHASVRNEVINHIGGMEEISEDEFNEFICQKTNHNHQWKSKNKDLFEIKNGRVRLSKKGRRIFDQV